MNKGYEASKEKLLEAARRKSLRARENYDLNPKLCPECGTPISYERKNDAKFCNSTCSAKYNNSKREVKYICLNCMEPLRKGRASKYCSINCQTTNLQET